MGGGGTGGSSLLLCTLCSAWKNVIIEWFSWQFKLQLEVAYALYIIEWNLTAASFDYRCVILSASRGRAILNTSKLRKGGGAGPLGPRSAIATASSFHLPPLIPLPFFSFNSSPFPFSPFCSPSVSFLSLSTSTCNSSSCLSSCLS